MVNKPTVIITHHTGGTDANPRQDTSNHSVNVINSWHKQQWPDFVSSLGYHVGYHYFIDKHGGVTQTRLHTEEGAHCIGMNKKSIGVCFAGNFDVTTPTKAQMNSWWNLYKKIRSQYPDIPTYPHRKYATKTCHGRLLSDTFFTLANQRTELLKQIEQLKNLLASLITKRRTR